MNKTNFRIISGILYLFSAIIFTYYLIMTFTPNVSFSTEGNVILFCLGCAGIYFGSLLMSKTISEKSGKCLIKSSFGFFFALYLVLILSLTLFDRMNGRNLAYLFLWNTESIQRYLNESCNFIPFVTISKFITGIFTGNISTKRIITNLLGNICAFMPFAFFLPVLFARMNKRKTFILSMILIVSVIELLQFATYSGSCDIDDVILNVGGAWVLYEFLHHPRIQPLIKKITLQ